MNGTYERGLCLLHRKAVDVRPAWTTLLTVSNATARAMNAAYGSGLLAHHQFPSRLPAFPKDHSGNLQRAFQMVHSCGNSSRFTRDSVGLTRRESIRSVDRWNNVRPAIRDEEERDPDNHFANAAVDLLKRPDYLGISVDGPYKADHYRY